MNKEELVLYEMPWYAEYISVDWMQNLIAKSVANRVNRKYKKYQSRKNLRRIFKALTDN